MAYQSKMLTTDVGDDDCAICRFLAGDRSTVSMLAVIRAMDSQLAEEERAGREMLGRLVECLHGSRSKGGVSDGLHRQH